MTNHSKKNIHDGGFTLAELLIVVAIIAVLVAILFPVFANLLEESRESTDMANIRGRYGEMMCDVMTEQYAAKIAANPSEYQVQLEQQQDLWQSTDQTSGQGAEDDDPLKNTALIKGTPAAGGTATLTFNGSQAVVTYGKGSGKQDPTVKTDPTNAFWEAVVSVKARIAGAWDSTYGGSSPEKAIGFLNNNANFDKENIKSWAIINPGRITEYSDLRADNSNLYYVWTTKDVKSAAVGSYVPAVMSNTSSNGTTTYTVGNVKVTYGDKTTYKVISNGENDVRPKDSSYSITNLFSGDGSTKTFSSYEEAARYYDQLAAKSA